MTKFSLFWILWLVTGNPLVAIVVLVVGLYALDRFALGLAPPWIRAWLRLGEVSRLRALVAANPHDRPARRALAECLLARRQYLRAVEVISPAIAAEKARPEAGALLVAAEAHLGAGQLDAAGAAIDAAHAVARAAQHYDLALLTGRVLEAAGRRLEAIEAYEEAVSLSQGRVEPRVRLARALAAVERPADAAAARKGAWKVYTEAPFFQQRRERIWAWRANPARPLMYGAVVMAFGIFLGSVVGPRLAGETGASIDLTRPAETAPPHALDP